LLLQLFHNRHDLFLPPNLERNVVPITTDSDTNKRWFIVFLVVRLLRHFGSAHGNIIV
jgi:hypothetical protein